MRQKAAFEYVSERNSDKQRLKDLWRRLIV